MENGAISDSQISASSEYTKDLAAKYARLNLPDKGWGNCCVWAPRTPSSIAWLQIDLLNQHTRVTAVATQGREHHRYYQWVKTYKLQYSEFEYNFQSYKEQGQAEDKVKHVQITVKYRF